MKGIAESWQEPATLGTGIVRMVWDNDSAALTASKAAGHVPQGRPGLDHNPAKDV